MYILHPCIYIIYIYYFIIIFKGCNSMHYIIIPPLFKSSEMSAIVRIECYKENLRFSFNLSLKGGSRSPSTSLIFLYGLTSFFFKQRFLMCRIAQLAPHDFTKILPKSYQNLTKISNFESHKSHCTSLTETLPHPHIQTITLRGTKVPL